MTNLLVNGDFESSLNGWDVNYGKVHRLAHRYVRWDEEGDHTFPAKLLSGTVKLEGTTNLISPISGQHMLQLNDLTGGLDATRLTQELTVPADFHGECAYVAFDYFLFMQGSSHSNGEQPRAILRVAHRRKKKWLPGFVKRWTNVAGEEFTCPSKSSDALANGWSDVCDPLADGVEPTWFLKGSFLRSLGGASSGQPCGSGSPSKTAQRGRMAPASFSIRSRSPTFADRGVQPRARRASRFRTCSLRMPTGTTTSGV